jgi:hypothetical protein
MYEYVQTATGWRLCWGGAALYFRPTDGPDEAAANRDDRPAEAEEWEADEPLTAPAA